MTPWLDDGDVRLYHGDALDVLRELPDASVHMCATSPPFYGLRDYGHEGQIGLEDSPDEWVARLVAVFAEVRRVLRDDATLWVEIGDSYSSGGLGGASGMSTLEGGGGAYRDGSKLLALHEANQGKSRRVVGHKPKDLLGQPWLLAFALRADGWYLRSEIIWARPNPMPESVTDRPTKAHSTVFLLSKRPSYYFDQDAIREAFAPASAERYKYAFGGAKNEALAEADQNGMGVRTRPIGFRDGPDVRPQVETLDGSAGESPRGPDGRRATHVKGTDASEQHRDGERWPNPSGANARSVWQIATEPTPFAHYATWPQKLVARMILAGTSEKGCCPECGAPWVRDVEREPFARDPDEPKYGGMQYRPTGKVPGSNTRGVPVRAVTRTGWSPSCGCSIEESDAGASWEGTPATVREGGGATRPTIAPSRHSPSIPCTVLDPFAGSATTCLVARNHGRRSIGIELSDAYLEIAADRLKQLSLLAAPA